MQRIHNISQAAYKSMEVFYVNYIFLKIILVSFALMGTSNNITCVLPFTIMFYTFIYCFFYFREANKKRSTFPLLFVFDSFLHSLWVCVCCNNVPCVCENQM